MKIPKSRLSESQLNELGAAVWKRDDLRAHIREELSNEALATRFAVDVRTVERAIKHGDMKASTFEANHA